MGMPTWKRQSGSDIGSDTIDGDGYDDGGYSWWWSSTGMAIRYTIICLIFACIVLYFVGGYFHVQRRMRKGLPPLPYHRWMVHRSVRYPQSQYNPYAQGDPYQQSYNMPGYAPPPPAYQPPHRDAPPAYTPPPGASKVLADQNYQQVPGDRNAGEGSQAAAGVPRQ